MLVLTRKVGQSIMIGDNIEVMVVSASADQVRIGINAPKDVLILRKELYDEVKASNIAASKSPVDLKEVSKVVIPGER